MEKIWKSAILIAGLALFLVACGSERTDSDAGEQSPMEIAPLPADETAPQQQQQQQQPPGEVNIPAGPDGIVHHYICVDRCEGGHSENPGFCAVCNKQLAHNRAWHEQGQQQQQPDQADPRTQFDPMRGGGETPPAQQQQQQMQQVNIPAGPDGIVHHYICIDQCAGGHSENPGFCPVCNKQLAHNQAWHNQ
ncbi:MAG: hypothetical protein EA362_08555 [Saprospirales bacterium]|nr:MAG: hypothetical protein EA362_08555 [Saprospirales bacterium]